MINKIKNYGRGLLIMGLLVGGSFATPVYAESLSEKQINELIALFLEIIEKQKEASQLETSENYVLSVGSRDTTTGGSVTKLQKMLIAENVYPEAIVSGYYGRLTSDAVVRLKNKYSMSDISGNFDTNLFALIEKRKKSQSAGLSLDLDDIIADYSLGKSYVERSIFDTDVLISSDGNDVNIGFLLDSNYIEDMENGQYGEIKVNHYLTSDRVSTNFVRNYDYIYDRNEMDSYVKLVDFNDVDKFDWYDMSDLKSDRGDWIRQTSETSEYFDFTDLMKVVVHNEELDLTEVEFDSKRIAESLTEAENQNIYEYDIVFDTEGYMKMLYDEAGDDGKFEDILAETAKQYGFDEYNDFYDSFDLLRSSLFLTEEQALYGIRMTYMFDAQESDMENVTVDQAWYVREEELPENFSLKDEIPNNFKRDNGFNIILHGLDL